jgi:hypothetical protein
MGIGDARDAVDRAERVRVEQAMAQLEAAAEHASNEAHTLATIAVQQQQQQHAASVVNATSTKGSPTSASSNDINGRSSSASTAPVKRPGSGGSRNAKPGSSRPTSPPKRGANIGTNKATIAALSSTSNGRIGSGGSSRSGSSRSTTATPPSSGGGSASSPLAPLAPLPLIVRATSRTGSGTTESMSEKRTQRSGSTASGTSTSSISSPLLLSPSQLLSRPISEQLQLLSPSSSASMILSPDSAPIAAPTAVDERYAILSSYASTSNHSLIYFSVNSVRAAASVAADRARVMQLVKLTKEESDRR